MFSRLLRGAHIPIGIQLPLDRIGLQQQVSGYPFDDIVAHGSPAPTGPRIQMQVKQKIYIRGKDPDFIKVMASAARAIREQDVDIADGALRLGLIAGGPATELAELREVAEMARAQPDHESLRALMGENITSSRIRARHAHVVAAVEAAVSMQGGEAAALAHHILASLHVWQVDLGPDGRDTRSEMDELATAFGSRVSAADLFAHLCDLAQECGPRAGQIDAQFLQRTLRSRWGLHLGPDNGTHAGHAPNEPAPRISLINNGSGPSWAAETQTFHNLDFRRH